VSLIIPAEGKNNNFVVGLGPSIGIIEWDGRSNKTSRPKHVKLVDETPGNRLNDGKADATGRLWVGKYTEMGKNHTLYLSRSRDQGKG
jgi:sugar lactone lactonase YvrE